MTRAESAVLNLLKNEPGTDQIKLAWYREERVKMSATLDQLGLDGRERQKKARALCFSFYRFWRANQLQRQNAQREAESGRRHKAELESVAAQLERFGLGQ